MVASQTKKIRHFFYSQAFADGFRTAGAILLPAMLGFYFNFFETGLTISLGAMCVSLCDAPGPVVQKRNGMMICCVFVFLVALLTPYAKLNIYTLGLEIALVSFFFSMFNVYGSRANSVGNAAILIMILTMETIVDPSQILLHAFFILCGGIFYTILSLLLHAIRPYRIAQRALGDCVKEIARYLSIKADFYNVDTALDDDYKKLVAQQIIVNEKQDAVRELFFKTRQIVEETTPIGVKLLFSFVETVDLFESITATYYDYDLLRKKFGSTGALDMISHSLKKIAFEIDAIGFAIQSNSPFKNTFDYDDELKKLKTAIDIIAPKGEASTMVLRKILVNLRKILGSLRDIETYFNTGTTLKKAGLDHSHFVSHQSLDPKILFNNFSLESSAFRHALRVCIACVTGFIIAKLISYGHHSYWILMTIAFMLKPAFSLTRQRNIERIAGTVIGGVIGILILVFIPNKTVLFVFMMLFMIGTYSFMRIQYFLMVICTTPYVLILFSFLGAGFKDVAKERLIDTLIGCTLASLASYILFPSWESEQVKNYMEKMLQANLSYLQKIVEALRGKKLSMLEYKLSRKEVYLSSANLTAAFQRMLSEPKRKQKDKTELHEFVVLNHILFSNIATVAGFLLSKEVKKYPDELLQLASKSCSRLQRSVARLEMNSHHPVSMQVPKADQPALAMEDQFMKEQLEFIYKVSEDIDRLTKKIIA